MLRPSPLFNVGCFGGDGAYEVLEQQNAVIFSVVLRLLLHEQHPALHLLRRRRLENE